MLRLTPLTMSASALNVVLVAAAFWGDAAQRPFLLMWGLGIAVVVARRAWAATNSR